MPIHSLQLGFCEIRTWILFGQVPFLILMLFLYRAGRGRGWSWRSALLATAALAGGLSLGAALLPSVVGAVAGGIALWLLAQRLLGLRRPPYASLALGLAAVIAVGRWGCLLNGCCFGQVTHLPWAVAYAADSAPWLLHRALGAIAGTAVASLPVHPYPIYESLGLFLWLAVAFRLRRRLRSEAALLLFTLAYDLALRAALDGTRAMINVWWALLGSVAGLDLFQWSLLTAALVAVAAGIGVERRARAQTAAVEAPGHEAGPLAGWAVFLSLWLIGWLTDTAQTIFLHRVLVGALALAVLALRLPIRLPVARRISTWLAPAAAAGLVLLLGLHIQDDAAADSGLQRSFGASRGWLYDVDHRRRVIVRVGTASEPEDEVNQRRAALDLDLPATDVKPGPASTAAPPSDRIWVGGGVLAGGAHYRVGESCNNDYTLYDRQAGGGWLEVQRESAASPTSVWWLGGRGLTLFETQTKTVHTGSSGTEVIDNYTMQTYLGQFWVGWEHPNISVGGGGMAGVRRTNAGGGGVLDVAGKPSLHLRAGFSFLGVDGGIYDRSSLAGLDAAHIGVSGSIGRGFTRIRHPDDTVVRYFVGGLSFPGADPGQTRLMLGGGLEVFVTQRLVLGFQGAGGDGGFGVGYLRGAVGP